jgi:hypothetical protein
MFLGVFLFINLLLKETNAKILILLFVMHRDEFSWSSVSSESFHNPAHWDQGIV